MDHELADDLTGRARAAGANAGWPLRVVAAEGEPYHRYALVLVE